MDFNFTAEQEMLRDSVARYCGDHYSFPQRQAVVRSAEGWRPGLWRGLADDENYVASDVFALLPVTHRFVFLDEGDTAEVRRDGEEPESDRGEVDRDHLADRQPAEVDGRADAERA